MNKSKEINPYDIYNKLVAMKSIGGSNYSINVNGKTFIASNFDVDELFITITGMAKAEYDEKYYKDNFNKNYFSWLITGKNLIPKELHGSWNELLEVCRTNSPYHGKEIEYALTTIQTMKCGISIDKALTDVFNERIELPEHFKITVEEIVRKFTMPPKQKQRKKEF